MVTHTSNLTHYLIKGMIFGGKVAENKSVFLKLNNTHCMYDFSFCKMFVSNISYFKENLVGYCHKCQYVLT